MINKQKIRQQQKAATTTIPRQQEVQYERMK